MSGVAEGVSDGVGVIEGVGLGVTGVFVGTGGRVFGSGKVATTVTGVGACVNSGGGVKVAGRTSGGAPGRRATSEATATALAVASTIAVGASVGSSAEAGWQAPRKMARAIRAKLATGGGNRRVTA